MFLFPTVASCLGVLTLLTLAIPQLCKAARKVKEGGPTDPKGPTIQDLAALKGLLFWVLGGPYWEDLAPFPRLGWLV